MESHSEPLRGDKLNPRKAELAPWDTCVTVKQYHDEFAASGKEGP